MAAEAITLSIDYDLLAEKIAQKILANTPKPAPLQAPEKQLWDAQECAEHIGVTRNHFVNIISKTTSFPAVIPLNGSIGRGKTLRWYASEVKAWIAQKQPKKRA